MLATTSRVGRKVLRVLPVELVGAAALLLPSIAPAPVSVVRAPAQALVAFAASSATDVTVQHHLLGRFTAPGQVPAYEKVDGDLSSVGLDDVLRVRFRLHNASTDTTEVFRPLLQYRPVGGSWKPVPDKALPRGVFHTRLEWVHPDDGRSGTVEGPAAATIATADMLMHDDSTEVAGHRSSAANPDVALSLPPGASTEQEFTLGLGFGAYFNGSYQLRLTDKGRALGDDVARVTIGAPPPVVLTPGQRQGRVTAQPKAAPASYSPPVQYQLVIQPAVFRSAAVTATAAATTITGIHGPYSATPDQCSVCHRSHTASGSNLLVKDESQAGLCFTCHDGTGSSYNVKSEYAGATANNPADRSYFQHDALAPSDHTLASQEEFAGVLNRHNECADCHDPHQANNNDSALTATGWTASGRLQGISGVAVTNGAAGSAPTYTFLDGVAAPVTAEYQLCLKCHSGYTTLPSNDGFTPSRYELDKGVELNPNNGSFHPVEAPGTNTTAKMADSLAGTSPYKLWNFTTASTIRCTQCHAAGSLPASSPAPGGNLPPHTSANQSILIAPYQDRVLNTATAPYSATNFQLCLLCHGEAAYTTLGSTTGTNFPEHARHLTTLAGKGSGGTDIDTPGAGQGNAICAECHFRIHSPVTMMSSEDISGQGLVSFAPDVQGYDSSTPKPAWTRLDGGGGGCSLTCHGFQHYYEQYF